MACHVAATMLLIVVVSCIEVANAASQRSSPSADRHQPRHISEMQLKGDLTGAAEKLRAVLSDVEASYQKTRKHLVTVRDHCQTQASESSVRMQTQETKIDNLQETREVNLQKQAEVEAELEIMKTAMDKKVASYQSSVAVRAKEATSFHSWNKTNAEYMEALGGAVDVLTKNRDNVNAESLSHLAEVKGTLQTMQREVAAKSKDMSTKHTEQDADYETLVNSFRKALADSEDAYATKRQQRDGFLAVVQGATEEKDIRGIASNGDATAMETMLQLCGTEGGELKSAISDGDALLLTVQSRVSETDTSLKGMPVVLLALAAEMHRQDASPQKSAPDRREEMKRLAEEIKHKSVPHQPHTFLGRRHGRQSARKAIAVKLPAKVIHASVKKSPALGRLATSAVVMSRRTASSNPTNTNDCVKEKQRIASEITVQRTNKQDAESQKRVAESRSNAIDQEIGVANGAKDQFDATSSSFSSTWMPLMSDIASDTYAQEMTAALAKMDEVETETNDYIKQGGPPEASALPLALRRTRDSITALRDEVQADLAKIEKLYTDSLMVTYPKITGNLEDKVTALDAQKEQADKDVTTATKAVADAQKKEDLLKNEWDQVVATCESYLKSNAAI